MDRRTALTKIAALALGATALCCGRVTDAHANQPHVRDTSRSAPNVSVSVERPGGGQFPTFFHHGRMFIGGEIGSRYQIRVTNNSFERIEAVVTVDGRDVVSGRLGNFRKQRGYVIAPHDSVVIEGFRQSLEHVASFRFADIENSYSGRMGTPQNVGVVGVAVFGERNRRPRSAPLAKDEGRRREAEAFPRNRSAATPKKSAPSGGFGAAAPGADADSSAAESEAAPSTAQRNRGHSHGAPIDDFAPAPEASPQLGTEYGETRHSSVREVTFRRRNANRPDRILTAYYDSIDGLEARGVPVHRFDHHHHHPHAPQEASPFPARAFAEPPPPRRF